MNEKITKQLTPFMAHQSSSCESDDKIPPHPLDLNSPHPSKDIIFNMEQSNLNNHEDEDRDNSNKDATTQTQQNPSASETTLVCCSSEEKTALEEDDAVNVVVVVVAAEDEEEESGRERLNRHRVEVAGRVWIPEIWGQEELLKDWIDCAAFDAPLVPTRISTARESLIQESTRANAAGLRIDNREKTVSYKSD